MSAGDACATFTVRANGTRGLARGGRSVPAYVAFLLRERAEGREDQPGEGLSDFLCRMAAMLNIAERAQP